MLLSPNEKTLYVALSNIDQVAEVVTDDGTAISCFCETVAAAERFRRAVIPLR